MANIYSCLLSWYNTQIQKATKKVLIQFGRIRKSDTSNPNMNQAALVENIQVLKLSQIFNNIYNPICFR